MKKEKYITAMFPYPSGSGLHCGHWYNYALTDSYCRLQKYLGFEVFQPFGYDSFGKPVEDYAIKVGRDPKEVTEENIENFRKEIGRMNTGFDEVLCTHSNYYQFINRSCWEVLNILRLVYKKNGAIYLKITDYKQRLIDDLETVDYPESTKVEQINWLNNIHDWEVSRDRKWGCPIPNTDLTFDTFFDSSHYTIQYCFFKGIKAKPVDLYVGGHEHATRHLIYARFITKALFDIGQIDFNEPFLKVIHQGMITKDGEKMSKTKGNTVSLEDYDSDTIRFYLMFMGHYFEGGEWSDERVKGIERFINRWVKWVSESGTDKIEFKPFEKKIIDYTEDFKFNKVVSEFMTFYKINKDKRLEQGQLDKLNKLLSVYMPGIKGKIYGELGRVRKERDREQDINV